MSDEGMKLHVDSDWKAQAQAEREKLRRQEEAKKQQEQSRAAAPASASANRGAQAAPRELPPATFETLVSQFTSQAMLYMGLIGDPRTAGRYVNLDMARFQIDLLSVLEEKTSQNVSQEEKTLLATTLFELRTQYVQVAEARRRKQ